MRKLHWHCEYERHAQDLCRAEMHCALVAAGLSSNIAAARYRRANPAASSKDRRPPKVGRCLQIPPPLNRSRVTTSQLEHLGLGDFMAASPDAYAAKAIEFATTRGSDLHALRTTLREQFLTSSLSYEASLVGALEQRFRQAWQRWCSPRDFA